MWKRLMFIVLVTTLFLRASDAEQELQVADQEQQVAEDYYSGEERLLPPNTPVGLDDTSDMSDMDGMARINLCPIQTLCNQNCRALGFVRGRCRGLFKRKCQCSN